MSVPYPSHFLENKGRRGRFRHSTQRLTGLITPGCLALRRYCLCPRFLICKWSGRHKCVSDATDLLFVVWLLSHVQVFCDLMDGSLPGSSVHGISQARILQWVAIPFSRRPSSPRDRTWVFCLACRFFTTEPSGNLFNLFNSP